MYKGYNKNGTWFSSSPALFVLFLNNISFEQKADTPYCRNGDNAVNDSCKNTVLASEYPSNKVEFEKANKPPVNSAYNIED